MEQNGRLEELNELIKPVRRMNEHIVEYENGDIVSRAEHHDRMVKIRDILRDAKDIALKINDITDTNDLNVR